MKLSTSFVDCHVVDFHDKVLKISVLFELSISLAIH